VIHKIRGCMEQGPSLSGPCHQSLSMGISGTPYASISTWHEMQISATFADPSRTKDVDEHRDYLINQCGSVSSPERSQAGPFAEGGAPPSWSVVQTGAFAACAKRSSSRSASGQFALITEPVVESVGLACSVRSTPVELGGVMIGGLELSFILWCLCCPVHG